MQDIAGIDVGLTFVDPTSGVCRTGPSGGVVTHTYADRLSRLDALGTVTQFDVIAIDAPVLRRGELHYNPRSCERSLSGVSSRSAASAVKAGFPEQGRH
jgi:hypothetical protein